LVKSKEKIEENNTKEKNEISVKLQLKSKLQGSIDEVTINSKLHLLIKNIIINYLELRNSK